MGSFAVRQARSALLAVSIPLLALGATPLAYAANNVGWVLDDQPTTYEPTLDPAHSFDSAGGSVSIIYGGNGVYSVRFSSLYDGAPASVQVSAYNSSGWCNTGGSGADTDENQPTTAVAGVFCYDAQGNPAPSAFTLLYQSRNAPFGSASHGIAFLESGGRFSGTYPANYSFNSTGGTNTVQFNTATYTVTLPGLTKLGGNAQVVGTRETIISTIPRCKLLDFGTGASSETVTVQCYGSLGARTKDILFYLAYAVGEPLGVTGNSGTLGGAWAFVNDPTSTTAYEPISHYQFNGFGTGRLKAQKTGTGLYTVTIPGTLNYSSSVALVTAVGADNAYCNLVGWTNGTINVACFKQGGMPVDSRFNLSFQTAN